VESCEAAFVLQVKICSALHEYDATLAVSLPTCFVEGCVAVLQTKVMC